MSDPLVTVLATTPLPGPIAHGNRTTRTLGQGLTRGQLEVLAGAARAAIAAPVLALHAPCHEQGQGDRCSLGHEPIADLQPVCRHCRAWPASYELHPCPTVLAAVGGAA